MKPSASIPALKRKARLLSRETGIPLHAALDRVAAAEGFARWSLLAARTGEAGPARAFLSRLEPGDLALVGARPGQGKTLMGLRLAVETARAGGGSIFFTLEYAEKDVRDRLRKIGADPAASFELDCSDAVCADHIAARLASKSGAALAVVDYLQLLDQDRSKPDLHDQVRKLKRFARDNGIVVVFISQIDRSYDASAKPFPDFADIRLPNPLDLTLFDKACFLNGGKARFHEAGAAG